MTTVKLTLSISPELKELIDDYNKNNPYRKLNLSKIAQHAIHEEIVKSR